MPETLLRVVVQQKGLPRVFNINCAGLSQITNNPVKISLYRLLLFGGHDKEAKVRSLTPKLCSLTSKVIDPHVQEESLIHSPPVCLPYADVV